VPKTASVPSTQRLRAKVWLAPRNTAQLDAPARAVSDPVSAKYGRFISAGQYQAQYAPTPAQVAEVSQWLIQAGLSVSAVGPGNHYVAVSGSAADMNTAFGTELGTFLVNGRHARAPATDVSVPDSVAPAVLAVTGLNTFGHSVSPSDFGPEEAFVNGTPCSGYYGQQPALDMPSFNSKKVPYAVCGYTPSQLRGVYGVASPGMGAGQTVAITDAYDSPRLQGDADTYSSRHGEPTFGPGQFEDRSVPEDVSTEEDCEGNTWYGEQTLDVEAIHGMAPGANVLYYGAASCFDDDLLAALAQVVVDDDASIVNNSWGEPTFVVIGGQVFITIDQGLVDAYESIFKQGAVQGIGFYFGSGDDGDDLAAWGKKHPEWPTEDPWVTSVGGTTLAIGRTNNRLFETGWGTARYGLSGDGKSWDLEIPLLYGSGGGFASVFGRPWYQVGNTLPYRTGGRAVPDIAIDGDPTTGMLIGETQSFPLPSRFGPPGDRYGEYRVGGTSLSSPLLAGVQAVAQEKAGRHIGFANPLIYRLARFPGIFYDVTHQGDPGNVRPDYVNGINADDGMVFTLRTFDQDSSLVTGPGWDPVTGVGTVTGRYLGAVALLH
jgi:subtilase family serine protease